MAIDAPPRPAMKEIARSLLASAFEEAKRGGELKSSDLPPFVVEIPKDPSHGELASNLALLLARPEGRKPRDVATILLERMPRRDDVESVELAGPGFLNFRFARTFWHDRLRAVLEAGSEYGPARSESPERIQVEFVSANPTGPLTVGHGRNAVLGDAIARLLASRGHEVVREYYFNNAGRQMKVLAESVRARYLEHLGRGGEFPEDGYQGAYITEIAETLAGERGDTLADGEDLGPFREAAETAIFADIEKTLARMRVRFDVHFNEDSLYRDGSIDRVLEALRTRGCVVERDGAVWLSGERVGLADDRVLVKSSGEPAYRLPDVAYHENKLGRGFDRVIDVLGADHVAENEEVKAALRAIDREADRIHAVIYQFVTLVSGGKPVKMSTRRANYVTLDELLSEVGVDVTRFLFLTRKSDSHLEFDLDVAKKQSMENPVYYVQYAHARISNILKKAAEAGIDAGAAGDLPLARLVQDDEIALVRRVVAFPELAAEAAESLEPHRLTFWLLELARELHAYYNQPENKVVSEDRDLSRARVALVVAVRRAIAQGLGLLGVEAPERM